MKILNINSIIDPIYGGGTAERTLQMSRYLSNEEGIKVSILTLHIGLTSSVLEGLINIKLITVPCINKRFYIPFIFSPKISHSIEEADVVHLMGHWSIINLVSYFWIRKYKKPYVVCPAGALPIFGRSKIFKYIYNFIGGGACIRNANKNIAISSDEFNHFNEYGAKKEKNILLPNGIEPESYLDKNNKEIRRQFSIGKSPFILFVGRLNKIKGPDLLLDAFSLIARDYPEYLLIFAGKDDGMKRELKNIVDGLNLKNRVKFIGFVKGKKKSQLFHAAELLVIPSRMEAMSIVVLESALTGTPVLMTNTCGLNEMSGIHGALAVDPDSDSLASGLREMLVGAKELKLRGAKMKDYVENNFYWSSIIKNYVQMYKKIVTISDN